MNKIVLWFTKITGYIPYMIYFKPKIYYENKKIQNRRIKGPAIIITNHISVIDFALFMMIFFFRDIYVLVGEVLFQKNKLLSWFLKNIGGIKVDRNKNDLTFHRKITKIFNKNRVVQIFPEGRLPREGENDLLPFKPGYVYYALKHDIKIIPVYTKRYYKDNTKKISRTDLIIGEPIELNKLYDNTKSNRENVELFNEYVYNHMKELGSKLNEASKK